MNSLYPLFDISACPVEPRTRPETPVTRELQRRSSNKARVLARLQQGPATTMELIAIGGARAVGRVFELKREGHPIRKEELKAGLFRYSLETK